MLTPGENLLVITRRLFEKDVRRHFVGEIKQVTGGAVRMTGYVFVFDESSNEFIRIDETRTRVFSLVDAGLILIVLPSDVNLTRLFYKVSADYKRFLTDGADFKMNVSEFGAYR